MDNAYARGDKTDYYVQPIVMVDQTGQPLATIKDTDSVIFWNFRSDRARQITRPFIEPDFDGFDRIKTPKISYLCMTTYDESMGLPVLYAPDMPQQI